VPPANAKYFRSPFLRDFWHLNVGMMTSNNALIPDPDKEDILASKPLDWPFLHLGLRMCGWGDTQIKYYLLGNPLNYWGGALSLIAFIVVLIVYLLRSQRRFVDMEPSEFWLSCHMKSLLIGLQRNGTTSFTLAKLPSRAGVCISVNYLRLIFRFTADRSNSPFPCNGPSHLCPPLCTFCYALASMTL
jgi:hypothetical protein